MNKQFFPTKKRPLGSKTLSVPAELHRLVGKVGLAEHLHNYEVVEKALNHYVLSFCPELLKRVTRR